MHASRERAVARPPHALVHGGQRRLPLPCGLRTHDRGVASEVVAREIDEQQMRRYAVLGQEVQDREAIAELVVRRSPVAVGSDAERLFRAGQRVLDHGLGLWAGHAVALELAEMRLGLDQKPGRGALRVHDADRVPARRRAGLRPERLPRLAHVGALLVVAQKADALPLRMVEALGTVAEGEVEPVDQPATGRLVDLAVQLAALIPQVAQQVILAAVTVADLAHEPPSSSSVVVGGAVRYGRRSLALESAPFYRHRSPGACRERWGAGYFARARTHLGRNAGRERVRGRECAEPMTRSVALDRPASVPWKR